MDNSMMLSIEDRGQTDRVTMNAERYRLLYLANSDPISDLDL